MTVSDPFGVADLLTVGTESFTVYRADRIPEVDAEALRRRPLTTRILLENLLRNADRGLVRLETVRSVADGSAAAG
ncbi:MAG: hypothetical protein ACRECR_03275, partial [Thermoplasmata archaeon]